MTATNAAIKVYLKSQLYFPDYIEHAGGVITTPSCTHLKITTHCLKRLI